MSKSLKRVTQALSEAALSCDILAMDGETRTAAQAAEQAGCLLDQIAKSIIFQGTDSGTVYLFVTAGGNMVDADKAAHLTGEPLGRADGKTVRAVTGFAIGGVSPVGHLSPPHSYFDPRLDDFDTIWAAAGTPRHIFAIQPADLLRISGAKRADFTA
ncbi:YbaK/EbsC family protein [Celeribacter marinus]|uniref:YbaK/EbsC family protein n=1 Tax=Celeribacter marinus TaxID=1397108 RepID=UPI00317A623C